MNYKSDFPIDSVREGKVGGPGRVMTLHDPHIFVLQNAFPFLLVFQSSSEITYLALTRILIRHGHGYEDT